MIIKIPADNPYDGASHTYRSNRLITCISHQSIHIPFSLKIFQFQKKKCEKPATFVAGFLSLIISRSGLCLLTISRSGFEIPESGFMRVKLFLVTSHTATVIFNNDYSILLHSLFFNSLHQQAKATPAAGSISFFVARCFLSPLDFIHRQHIPIIPTHHTIAAPIRWLD